MVNKDELRKTALARIRHSRNGGDGSATAATQPGKSKVMHNSDLTQTQSVP